MKGYNILMTNTPSLPEGTKLACGRNYASKNLGEGGPDEWRCLQNESPHHQVTLLYNFSEIVFDDIGGIVLE